MHFIFSSFVAAQAATSTYTVQEPAQTNQPEISYLGGKVMANGVNVYGIFYGNHSTDTINIIKRFVAGLSGSKWWGVVETYDGSNGPIKPTVSWAGEYIDNYSLGKNLNIGDLDIVIDHAVNVTSWPKDKDGIYVVFTGDDVTETSINGQFCELYCGYHGITESGLISTMVGDATSCRGSLPPPGQKKGVPGCMPRYWRNQTDSSYSINKNQHADGMISTLAHELAEAASDYDNAWRDENGEENGDKCAAYFLDVKGIGSHAPYDGAYNLDFGENGKYLVQSMWSAKSQKCVLYEERGHSSQPIKKPAENYLATPKKQRIRKLYD